MSYIYEALLKAEHERKNPPPVESEQPHAATMVEAVPPPPVEERHAAALSVAQFVWHPFLPSFPTLTKHGRGLEQFRSLRSHIYQARNENPVKTLLVSSGMPAEGKSFVAANLAVSLARNSANKILLIDADLRRPSLHSLLGTPNDRGLSDYLAGTCPLREVMQQCDLSNQPEGAGELELANLTFIPTGAPVEHASELIANLKIKDLVAEASATFDWILIDSPPVLVFSDAVDLARAVDSVLLVVRGSQTTYEIAQRAQSSFANSHILGVVLNDIKNPPRRDSYYNYYYYDKRKGSEQPVTGEAQEKE